MSKYIKVKPNTEAWNLFNKLWTYKDKWVDNRASIEEFLGFSMQDSLYFNIENLTIKRHALPKEWEIQFKKNADPAEAKKNSELNKGWIALCRQLGLTVTHTHEISFPLGIWNLVECFYPPMNGDYYFSTKEDHNRSKSSSDEMLNAEWVEEVDEPTYLRIRADFLEKDKNTHA